ncbi:hypothetical protein MSG28_003373 [Choristoneura fumiferana]|nr:hypothetical protein MSG28_003373 [Choristoneura fumiferana]
MYCSDPFSEETIQAGEELMSELSASRREKWCELVVDTDMTHNSKKAWSNLRKLTGDPPPAANPGQVSANQVASQLLLNGKPAGRLRRTHLESSCSRGGTGDLSKPFTLQEFDCAMESLKNGKAAGVDDLTVHLHSETSRWRSQKNGLPQGSVLAPTLFNIYTNDQPAPPNTQRFLYADDLALAAQSGTFGDVEGTLSAALETLSQYYEQNCLRPNPAKTQSCAFHLRNRDASRPLDVTWGGVRIEHCPHPRYLGITLDRTLTYKSHCANTQHKVISRNNLLRRLTSTNWGANAHTLRTTGLALSFSAGEYACPVWHRSAHAKLVTSALNDTCRMVTGCLRPTPLNQLYPLAGIAPPEIRREVACSIEKRKQEQDPRHPLKSFTEYPDKTHHRVAWFRLASSAEKLMYWARHSALPPSSLIVALQAALLDPALELFYPTLNNNIQDVLQFMKTRNSYRDSKQVLTCIKRSLPAIELHLSEPYLNEVADILLQKMKHMDLNNDDWSLVRSIALSLMAHDVTWIRAKFYKQLAELVKSVLVGDEMNQAENEKSLALLCDVSILTEICCHGLSSKIKEIETSASDIMLYLLRGRLVLSEGCWWRLLASMLPIFPLLQVYAAHETEIGQAICKSLEPDIAECMGVGVSETMMGLVRLLFVHCVAVKMEAAHGLCRLLDVLLNALRRVQPQNFNVDSNKSPLKNQQSTGLAQILDVLKQDIILDEHGSEYVTRPSMQPTLEPSLRRSTLQQLSVMVRQQDSHDTFLQCDGLKVIVTILRLSLMVDDYLAFPECAISCVSVLNSELDANRCQVPALPLSVVQRTSLPFNVNSYWSISPNAEHSTVDWRASIRLRWWCAWETAARVMKGAPGPPAPLALRPTARDLSLLQAAAPTHSATKALLALENATYTHLVKLSRECGDFGALPWQHMKRFLCAPPASPRDTALLISLLQFIIAYMDNVPKDDGAHAWIKSCFIGKDASIISLLSRERLFPQQTTQEDTEVTQLHIHIVKVLLRCVVLQETYDDFDSGRLESLVKILLACLERVDLRNFHMLEVTLVECLKLVTRTLSGCAAGGGRKGQACRLDAMLALLAMLQMAHEEQLPVQRWSEACEDVAGCVVLCAGAARAALRAAALRVAAHFARYAQLTPQLLQAIPSESLAQYALGILSSVREANAVRAAAAALLATLMLNVQKTETDFAMTDALITSNSFIFMLAGLETSSTTMSFCLYELAKHKEVQDLVRADILECMDRHGGLNYDSVCSMKLTSQVCMETLRLHPPTPFTTRLCTAPCVLSGTDLKLKPKDPVLLPLQCIQRDPRYFPDPEKFDPDRFKDGAHPPGFIAFGEGPRSCPGGRFAQLTVVAGLAAMLSKMEVEPCALTTPQIEYDPRSVLEREIIDKLQENNFLETCIEILVDFCNEKVSNNCFEPNIPPSILERRSELEVRAEKCGDVRIAPSAGVRARAPTAALVTAIADVLHNVAAFKRCPVPAWNEQGLYRLLFRCASWSNSGSDNCRVRAAACRALVAAVPHRCVRAGLSATKDCLHNLLLTLTPVEDAFQDAGIFCLTQLAQSATDRKHPDKTKDESCIEYLDNLKSPYFGDDEGEACDKDSDCQPEYLVEELCKMLMQLFQDMSQQGNLQEAGQTELLELLSGSLLTGDTAEIVAAARAVWALAANNHKAKLLLRSARMPAAVLSAQQRVQRSADPAAARAHQLLTYTLTVLQTT